MTIDDRRVEGLRPQGTIRRAGDLDHLSPADALFGCMGYRGRIRAGDGTIEGPAATEPLQVAPLDSPVMHRLAKPGKSKPAGSGKIRISEVEGRKFYYDGPLVTARQRDGAGPAGYELVDSVPKGATITLDVHFDSLSRAELGALVVAAGHGEGVGVVRFGGFKSVGLGKVELRQASALASAGSDVRSWRRGERRSVDLEAAVVAAGELIDAQALQELDQITRRERPA